MSERKKGCGHLALWLITQILQIMDLTEYPVKYKMFGSKYITDCKYTFN